MGKGAGTATPGDGGALPSSRSFVVQFGDATAASAGVFVGRIEHIDSSQSRRFTTLDGLAEFVAVVLDAGEDDAPP